MTITDSTNPSFIIRADNKKICALNENARIKCDKKPIGLPIHEFLYINREVSDLICPVFFGNQWLLLKESRIEWKGSPHLKISLHKRNNIPKIEELQHLKRMIGVLLHRIRSPLTSIQGYTDLFADQLNNKENYIDHIEKGINQLFELLDELENLEKVPREPVLSNNWSVEVSAVIKEVVSKYPQAKQEKINFSPPPNADLFACTPGDLRKIISILIDNALEYSSIENSQVYVTLPAPNAIKVSHNGQPIADAIVKNIFNPFVTSKAQKLGIGLTTAYLYAQRYQGSIFLTKNDPFQEISFTFLLPPSR